MSTTNDKPFFQEYKQAVDDGREGRNKFLPLPFPRLTEHIGVGRSMYHLIGGDSGTGKSAFVHLAYILGPYNVWKRMKVRDETDIDFKVLLFSMERSRRDTLAKWACMYVLMRHGIMMDVNTLLGRGVSKSRLPDDVYQVAMSVEEYFEELDDHVTIVEGLQNPTGIYKRVVQFANQNGITEKVNQFDRSYTPNNPHLVTVVGVDHIGKLVAESGMNDLQKLTKMGEYLTIFRDFYGFSPVVVSQFNRGKADSTRRTQMVLKPEDSDFKGSGSMYEDCDAAIALFNPHRYHMSDYEGYHIQRFITETGHNRFRAALLLKNTYGVDGIESGMNFIGEVGLYREMPLPGDMIPELYAQYRMASDIIKSHA